MIERMISWLIDAARVIRALALFAALVTGAILERAGVLPDAAPGQRNGSLYKSLVDKEACPPPLSPSVVNPSE